MEEFAEIREILQRPRSPFDLTRLRTDLVKVVAGQTGHCAILVILAIVSTPTLNLFASERTLENKRSHENSPLKKYDLGTAPE